MNQRRKSRRIRRAYLGSLAWGLLLLGWVWPKQGTELLRQAGEAYAAGRYGEAVRAYEEAARRWPQVPEIAYNLGNAYYRLGRYVEAADAYTRALQHDRRGRLRNPAHYNRGNAYYRLGYPARAFEEYEAALQADPHDEDARYNKELMRRLLQRLTQPPPPSPSASSGERESSSSGGGQQPPTPVGDSERPAGPTLSEREVDRILQQLAEDERSLQQYFEHRPRQRRREGLTARDLFTMSGEEIRDYFLQPRPQADTDRKDW